MEEMRRLAAILAADLVGYTRLMSADEAGTLARLKALREDVLEPIVAAHQGRVVKLIGDGLLVEFTSAVEAVACATEWQEHVVEQEAARDPNARLQFRIGINIGDVIVEGDDLYGEGVNIAARMEGLAEPGGICLSAKVHQEVVNKLPLAFEDLGAKKLKNVSEPVRVYRISPGSHDDQGIRQADSGLARSDKPSIAVLPFTNMSDDPEQSYFSDGITEDIITELSRFHTLFVIARNSTFAYKGQAVKVQDVGRDLGVAYVVEGSVRKSGARVRVTSQLVETASGNHVWADRYDRSIDEIFAVQDELVQRIVTTLVRRVEDVTRETIARKLPENMAAYDYVLRGYPHVFRAASPGDTARAREFLEKALVADPSYGRAQAVLALSHLVDVFMFWATDPAASMKLAYETAQKAVRLDNSDNVTHWVLGEVLLFGKSNHAHRARLGSQPERR
jgi:adenylate cyclase